MPPFSRPTDKRSPCDGAPTIGWASRTRSPSCVCPELAGELFQVMASGGRVGFEAVAWFNGGLFDDGAALPLEQSDIETVLAAADLDWSEIDPSILGTLFERGLDPGKRAQLGAHYTDREKILQLVEPGRGPVAARRVGAGEGRDRALVERILGCLNKEKYKPTELPVIISLMKILPCKGYVEYFLDGKLYCNTVQYFRDKGYDEFEGAAFLHPTTLRIGSHTVPEEDLVGPVILTPNLVANLNVFCMFSWRAPKVGDDEILIDLESQLGSIEACIAEFGTYTVVVKNTTEFLRRVELAAVLGGGILSHVRGSSVPR